MRSYIGLPLLVTLLFVKQGVRAQDEDDHEAEAEDMGPAAFMWPEDREWVSYHDNVEPCGSSEGPGNRTEFPLTGGLLSLVQQEESYDVEISISYQSDPQSNTDFTTIIAASRVKELDPGHQCLPVPDPPSDVVEGSNATFQVQYISQFDHDVNETFYACADVVYVPASQFTFEVPCFNVSEPEPSTSPAPTATSTPEGSNNNNDSGNGNGNGNGNGGLSGGAIAGIVIGCVAALAAVGVLLFFLYRRDQREKRLAAHEMSSRNVKWNPDVVAADEAAKSARGASESGGSVARSS